jgi:creatinine amidohydrolase
VGPLKLGVPLFFDEITDNGALGEARLASEAFGRELADAIVSRSVEFVERFLDE